MPGFSPSSTIALRIVARCESLQLVVEPIVGDGQGMGHFGRVEEVRRIEIGEPGHCLQLLPKAVEIAPVAMQAIGHGQRITVLQHAAAGVQQPLAVGQDVFGQLRGQAAIGVMPQLDVPLLEHRIGSDLLPQGIETGRIDQQPRMLPLDLAGQILGRRDGNGGPRGRFRILREHRLKRGGEQTQHGTDRYRGMDRHMGNLVAGLDSGGIALS